VVARLYLWAQAVRREAAVVQSHASAERRPCFPELSLWNFVFVEKGNGSNDLVTLTFQYTK
jgi:hypothetical protein